jgi:hypothetical protein
VAFTMGCAGKCLYILNTVSALIILMKVKSLINVEVYVNVQTVLSVVPLFMYKHQCDEGLNYELKYGDSLPGSVLCFLDCLLGHVPLSSPYDRGI